MLPTYLQEYLSFSVAKAYILFYYSQEVTLSLANNSNCTGAKKLKVPLWGGGVQCTQQLNYNSQLASQLSSVQLQQLARYLIDAGCFSLQLAGYSPASLINFLYLARDSLLWRLCCYVLLLVVRLPIVGIVSYLASQLANFFLLMTLWCAYSVSSYLAQSWEKE